MKEQQPITRYNLHQTQAPGVVLSQPAAHTAAQGLPGAQPSHDYSVPAGHSVQAPDMLAPVKE